MFCRNKISIGVDRQKETFHAVVLERKKDFPQLVAAFTAPTLDKLRQCFVEKIKQKHKKFFFSIALNEIIQRELTLPVDMTAKDIYRYLKETSQEYFDLPTDQMVYDFVISASEKNSHQLIQLYATEKRLINQMIEDVKQWSGNLWCIEPSLFAYWRVFNRWNPSDQLRVLFVEEAGYALLLIGDQSLKFSVWKTSNMDSFQQLWEKVPEVFKESVKVGYYFQSSINIRDGLPIELIFLSSEEWKIEESYLCAYGMALQGSSHGFN